MAHNGFKRCSRRHYGHLRDSPDARDIKRRYGTGEIPHIDKHPVADLRGYLYHVYDQGDLNSCTANVVCAAYGVVLQKKAAMMNHVFYDFDPARLFVYYNSRGHHPDMTVDTGATLRNSLKVMRSFGVCRESFWPYQELQFSKKPLSASYQDAMGNNITEYESLVQDIDQFRACLHEGFPFAFGFEIYEDSFDRITRNGLMPIPSDAEIASTTDLETHAALAVGYDDNTRHITVLNSWGDSFGDKGYFYMPYDYITDPDRAFDFWKIAEVENRDLGA